MTASSSGTRLTGPRVLVLTLDGAGNVVPLAGVIQELMDRGSEVHVVAHNSQRRTLSVAPAVVHAWPTAPESDSRWTDRTASRAFLWAVDAVAHDTRSLVASVEPDVLVIDMLLIPALTAAETMSVRTVVAWHTLCGALLTQPAPLLTRLAELTEPVRRSLGLPVNATLADAYRPFANVVLTFPELDPVSSLPSTVHTGPVRPRRLPALLDEQQHALARLAASGEPVVLVTGSSGYVPAQRDYLRAAVAAVRALGGHAITTSDDPKLDAWAMPGVDHAALLPHADVCVGLAGHGTVTAALSAGVPVIAAPVTPEQEAVLAAVESVGAGRGVATSDARHDLTAALRTVLDDDRYRAAAAQFMGRPDGASGAADQILAR